MLTMLLSLTKTLENYYDKISIEEITSMIVQRNPVPIFNTKSIFDTAQITGIVDEFVNYGRSNSLRRYMIARMDRNSQEEQRDIWNILQHIEQATADIQLCRTSLLLNDFYGPDNLKKNIDSFVVKYMDSEDVTISILKNLLNLIMEELNHSVYNNYDENCTDPICYLPNMINWCNEKSFSQQALTLSAERMPEYLFASKKIELCEELATILEACNSNHYEKRYYFISHMQNEFLIKSKEAKINMVIDAIKAADEIPQINSSDWAGAYTQSSITSVQVEQLDSIVSNVIKFIKNYFCIDQITNSKLLAAFGDCDGFPENPLDDIKVDISNKFCNNPIGVVLKGKRRNKDGTVEIHPNLSSKKDRILKSVRGLIESQIDFRNSNQLNAAKTYFNEIVDRLFAGTQLADAVKERYCDTQSQKFYVEGAVAEGLLKTNMVPKDFQKLMYLYSICKEQRNLSNHAHVAEEDMCVAMNSEQIGILIRALLKLC